LKRRETIEGLKEGETTSLQPKTQQKNTRNIVLRKKNKKGK